MITSLSEITLTKKQKIEVLEWYAYKVWMLQIKKNIVDGSMKMYDPLEIDIYNKISHSYVFNFEDGGRHHPFNTLDDIEKWLFNESLKEVIE